MAEQRLIDGKRLYRKLIEPHKYYGSCDFEHTERKIENKREIDTIFRCMDYVKSAPTVKAVEVVRCEKCKHNDLNDIRDMSGYFVCHHTNLYVCDDDYCSYGKAKEGDNGK